MYLANSFNLNWLYYIIGAVLVIAVIIIAVVLIVKNNRKKAYFRERREADNKIILALGGRDNILTYKANGSRLSLTLKDYTLVDDEALKKCGVASLIKMSNKITLVIGEETKEIEQFLSEQ